MSVRPFKLPLYDQIARCKRQRTHSGASHIDRQKGSHVTLMRDDPFGRATVPNHNKPLKRGTLSQIIKDAGLTVAEFVDLL